MKAVQRRHSWRQNLKDLTALSETLIGYQGLGDLYIQIAQRITQIFSARSCLIMLYDSKTRTFEIRSEYGAHSRDPQLRRFQADLENLRPWNFLIQGTLFSNSASTDERLLTEFVHNYGVKRVILAPMIVHDRLVGLIAVMNKRGKFTEFDSYLASIIAYQTGNIVTNARLMAEEKRRVEQIRMLSDLAHRINSTLVPEEIMEEVLRAAIKSLGMKEIAIYMPSEDGSILHIAACTGPSTKLISEQGYIQSVNAGLIGKCYRTGKSLLSNNCMQDPVFLQHPLITTYSEMCVPVRRDGKVLAVLDVESSDPDAFTEEDLLTVETLADQLAVAFTNAMVLENERKHNVQLLLLSDLISEISSIRDPNEIVKTTVERIKQRFQYYFIAIGLVDREAGLIKDWYHLPAFDNVTEEIRKGVPITQGLTGRVVRTGKTLMIGNVKQSQDYLNILSEVRSEMVVPVKIGDTIIGIIDLESDLQNAFDESDRLSMETLAHALSTAIQNANSYRELEKINAQLEETARMKDEIIQIVAHDFRSPLTVIRGYMDHLLKKDVWKDDRQKEIMETVSFQAQRLQRLAEATLKASRLDSGDISFSYEKMDFGSFLQRLVYPWSEKHTFVLDAAPDLPLVRADAGRLQEVMENILSNAIKYSPHGGNITIHARKAKRDDLSPDLTLNDAPAYLLVSVIDEGIGIPKEKKELLFRRFTRLHDIRRIEGIGLGLYIAKKMIETHGGAIWAEDRDKGACFMFALPGLADQTGEDTLLIIDDDIHTLRMLHRSITQLGYDVITAAEGKEAMDKVVRFHPRLVVVDILMPGMSGDDLIRQLREAAGSADIPIIVFTGQRDYRPAPEYSNIPVISKNAGVDALAVKIREVIGD